MTKQNNRAEELSHIFSAIYYHCHPQFQLELSDQAVRALQFVQMTGPVTVQQVADHLGCAHNTASEILRRLGQKGLIERIRNPKDERVVEAHLTSQGRAAVLEHTGLDIDKLTKCLDRMSDKEQAEVLHGFVSLLRTLEGLG